MTTIFDAPEDFATTALAGFADIYSRHVRLVRGGVVRATKVPKGKVSVVVGGGQNAAATALQQNGDIGPTIRVRMGEPIRVFTARDLDFGQAPRL